MTSDTKILAQIIGHMKSQEQEPLTALVDEYLLKRDLPKYRKKRIREFRVPILPRLRPLGRLSPSSLLSCERKAAFLFLGVRGRKRIDPDQELIFEDGNWRHHKWGALFLDMQAVLGEDRIRVVGLEIPIQIRNLYIAGNLDAHLSIGPTKSAEDIIVDMKGANEYIFNLIYRTRKPKEEHEHQILPYMRASKTTKGILLYDGKEKNKIFPFVINHSQDRWAKIKLWSASVIEQLEEERVPRKHPDCQPGNLMYKNCPFKRVCWGDLDSRQIRRMAFKGFPGVDDLWEKGHSMLREGAELKDD